MDFVKPQGGDVKCCTAREMMELESFAKVMRCGRRGRVIAMNPLSAPIDFTEKPHAKNSGHAPIGRFLQLIPDLDFPIAGGARYQRVAAVANLGGLIGADLF